MGKYHTKEIRGIRIFYREAGLKDKPYMVLLHGFPSASHMFRDLMPLLEKDFHIIAPDYPGFGQSGAPSRESCIYTFDNIAEIMDEFLQTLGIDKFYMYVFDYGAPLGFRIAVKHPRKILGIISQNGNIYEKGLGRKWAKRKDFWENPTEEKRRSYQVAFDSKTIIEQYLQGAIKECVSPDGYTLDIAYTRAPDYAERQLDLIYDYQSNVKLYPVFQQYLREYQPKLLAVWGKNDVSFIPQGAEAFLLDDMNAQVHLLDSGHFALETHAVEIAELIKKEFAYN